MKDWQWNSFKGMTACACDKVFGKFSSTLCLLYVLVLCMAGYGGLAVSQNSPFSCTLWGLFSCQDSLLGNRSGNDVGGVGSSAVGRASVVVVDPHSHVARNGECPLDGCIEAREVPGGCGQGSGHSCSSTATASEPISTEGSG